MPLTLQDVQSWRRGSQLYKSVRIIGMLGLAWASLELLSYILIRPLFLRLLDANAKLAADNKQKRVTATQMLPRVVCFVHNAIQIPLAICILLDPYFSHNTIWATDDFSTLVMAISGGYFLYDTVECIVRFEHEGPDFLLHGLFCLGVFINLTCTGYMHYYGAGFLLWELSTPFMHLRWFLYKIGKDHTAFYSINALMGMATFFLCRIVWGNALTIMFWVDSYQALHTARGPELPIGSIWFYRVATLVMNGLNAWWFSKMVKILVAAIRAKPAGKTA